MKKSTYSSPMSRYMKFGGDPKLLRAPLSNIGMPLIGFKDGGHVNQWRDELLHAPMSNTGMPVMGLFQQGGMVRDNLMRAPMSNIGMPLIGFKHGGMPCQHGGNCYEDGGMVDEYKEGGIHIAKNKVGTFTAAAKKHGKGVQEFASQVLANKENYSPAMVKKANFARNAAKWHEYGGPTEYAIGGNFGPNGLPIEDDYDPSIIGKPPAPKKYPTDTGVVQQRPPAPWMKKKDGTYMNNTQATANINYGKGSVGAYDPNTGNTPPRPQYPWMQAIGNAATQTVGAGMALGSHINSLNNIRDVHRQSQQMGLTSSQPYMNPNGLKGDYTPNTHMFRPQDMVPTNTGMYYPTMGQYGGRMEHGGQYWDGSAYRKYDYASRNGLMEHGGYVEGDEAELDEATIQKLIKQGYKVQYL